MTKTLQNEFAVGLFVIAVITVFSFLTFKVTDITFGKEKGYLLYARFQNTAGLSEKSKIQIAGVDAGVVEDIDLEAGTAVIKLRMFPEIEVYPDAVASIKAKGLLGDKYLSINPGSEGLPLKDGDDLKNVREVFDIEELVKNISQVTITLNSLLLDVNKLIEEEQMTEIMTRTLRNLEDTTRVLKASVSENDAKLQSILTKVDSILASVDGIVKANEGAFITDGPVIIANLRAATEELKNILEASGPEIESTMDSVSSIANKIESGEGTIGKLVNDPKLYNTVASAVDRVDQTLSKVDKFRTFLSFSGDYLTSMSDVKGRFEVTLQPKKDKYYVLGVVSDPLGHVDRTETTVDGVKTVREEVKSDLEFNAQFAHRFSDTALRIGLTETTFGVGADRFFMDDKMKLSFDAWDFGADEHGSDDAHLRFGLDYFLFKNVFLSAGYDNPLNENETFFLGGGIRFEDEDFKYIFGSVPSIPGQ